MNGEPLTILLVEDNRDHAELSVPCCWIWAFTGWRGTGTRGEIFILKDFTHAHR
ncbi:MAG: hypothetical protein ACOYL3_14135 [Desulfuromonadaceae bacterium]